MTNRAEVHALVDSLPQASLEMARMLLSSLVQQHSPILSAEPSWIGLFGNEPDILDQLVEDVYEQRERPWCA